MVDVELGTQIEKCMEAILKKHIPGVLSTGNSMETAILLKLDDLSDRLVLNRLQFLSIGLASSNSITLLNQLIGAEQRANVLGSERWASLCSRHVCIIDVCRGRERR